MNTDPKLINDICLISRHGVCLLDMRQVADKAQEIGLTRLAEIVAADLEANQITNGSYAPALAAVYGMQL